MYKAKTDHFSQKGETKKIFKPFLQPINPQIPEFHKDFIKLTLYDPPPDIRIDLITTWPNAFFCKNYANFGAPKLS